MSTSRTDFNNTWLYEMPQRINSLSLYKEMVYDIKERIDAGSPVIDIKDGFKKIEGEQTAYYWYEENDVISLAAEFSIKPQGLVVNGVSRNPAHMGPPYASTLYTDIMNHSNKSIRSDTTLTDEGFALWSRLFQLGNKISVYNTLDPGSSFITIKNIEDMKKYFGPVGTGKRNYQFVLSRPGEMFAEAQSMFNTRRMRELSGLPLND